MPGTRGRVPLAGSTEGPSTAMPQEICCFELNWMKGLGMDSVRVPSGITMHGGHDERRTCIVVNVYTSDQN